MTKEEFQQAQKGYAKQIAEIREAAHTLHQRVNQTYGDGLPYGVHLDMVAESICAYGHLVCVSKDDVLPIFFGGYFHDSIEDARLSYHDVLGIARKWLTEEQALMAAEIVYALTNDKGRNRAERAGEKYYQGIRETPYAPFVKLCDRMANITFTCSIDSGKDGHRMREIYKGEMSHFLTSINAHSDDPRRQIPFETLTSLAEILIEEVDRDEVRRQWGESIRWAMQS